MAIGTTNVEILAQLPSIELPVWDSRKKEYLKVLVDGDYDGEYFGGMQWRMLNNYVTTIFRKNQSTKIFPRTVYLHTLVLPPRKGYWTGFLNGNHLDCRSANLAYMTPSEIMNIREQHRREGMYGEYKPSTREKRNAYQREYKRLHKEERVKKELTPELKEYNTNYYHEHRGRDKERIASGVNRPHVVAKTALSSSIYRGVRKARVRQPDGSHRYQDHLWEAKCVGIYLGQYVVEEQAARAYDKVARKRWGEYAITNFPEEVKEKHMDNEVPIKHVKPTEDKPGTVRVTTPADPEKLKAYLNSPEYLRRVNSKASNRVNRGYLNGKS